MEIQFNIACLMMPRVSNICERTLESVYGASKTKSEYKEMRCECIKNIGRCMIDLNYYLDHTDLLAKRSTVHNEHHLQKALEAGKGAIVITGHMGNFPLMFVQLIKMGYKVNVVIRPMRSNAFGDFMYRLCARGEVNMIETSPPREFFKRSLTALRNNELLFILYDEPLEAGDGAEVDFLGGKVVRPRGPLMLHERSKAPILPMFIVKDEKSHFQIFIEDVLAVGQSNTERDNYISQLTQTIEEYVRKYPLQWGGWLNKRNIRSSVSK